MQATAYKSPLIQPGDDVFESLKATLPTTIPEKSILVVASKLLSTCENRFVEKTGAPDQKHDLARQEAEYYLDPHSSKYNLMLTIKRNWMFVNAGIDESNAKGDQLLLWPSDPQASVNAIWEFLRSEYGVQKVGVTISDSTSIPLSWGIVGHAIAYCGFKPLKSYIGRPDLFGRPMLMEQVNIMQAVTVAGVYTMGEGNERQPCAIVSDVGEVEFQDAPPTDQELADLHIELEDDAFAPILTSADWQPGGAISNKKPEDTN